MHKLSKHAHSIYMENCKFAKEHFAELTTFFICFILIWHFNSPRKIYMSNSRQKNGSYQAVTLCEHMLFCYNKRNLVMLLD